MNGYNGIDDIKAAWQNLNVAVPPPYGGDGIVPDGLRSHRATLMFQQKCLGLLAGLWALISVPLLCLNPGISMPLWAGIYTSVYFAVMCILAVVEYYAFKDVDMGTMSVKECMGAVLKAKHLRLRIKIAGTLMCTPILGYMLWYFYQISVIMFVGAVCGAVAGLIIGIIIDIKARRHLRDMSRYLSSLSAGLSSERVSDCEVECE